MNLRLPFLLLKGLAGLDHGLGVNTHSHCHLAVHAHHVGNLREHAVLAGLKSTDEVNGQEQLFRQLLLTPSLGLTPSQQLLTVSPQLQTFREPHGEQVATRGLSLEPPG